MFQAFGDLLFISMRMDDRDYKAGDVNHLYLSPRNFSVERCRKSFRIRWVKYTGCTLQHSEDKRSFRSNTAAHPLSEAGMNPALVLFQARQVVVFVRDITKYKLSG
jgi:hypothetical protein